MNINRDYLIINDVKKSNIKLDNGSMFFYITDKNTQNIFVNLVINVSNNDLIQKYANIENAEDYTLTMNIVKPDNTYKVVEGKLHDKEKAIFEFNLNKDCCDEIGTYRCELLTKCNINGHEEITTSNKLTYKVKASVLNDLDDIVEAPEYPLVIQLFDKLSDIEQYEEDRRANELARQLAEEQRQTRFNTLDADMVDRVNAMDSKMDDVEARISAKEQAVDKLITDTKADIDEYKVAKDQEIDDYKTAKDAEINNAITAQDNKIDTAISNQNDRIDIAINEQNNKLDIQNNRLDIVENKNQQQDNRLDIIEAKNVEQDNRLNEIEAIDVAQNSRLDNIEAKNTEQDNRLLDIEKVNKRQDMDLKCLFAESKNNMIDVTEEGNSVYLQNSTVGYTLIDEIQGNTMVNCNKEADKEIILNGNINTQGYSNVTLTEGVDGGLVDVALEGKTMVNVCNQKDPVAITKSYTVETGNHVALQGEYDGKCRPVVTGNTLVNLAIMRGVYSRVDGSNGANSLVDLAYGLKPSTVYTRIVNVSKVILGTNSGIAMYDAINSSDGTYMQYNWLNDNGSRIYITTPGIYISKFTTSELGTQNIYQITPGSQAFNGSTGAELEISNLILLEGDYTNKPIPDYFTGLQSTFEDDLVTQEMVDSGEEVADNLGKYKVDYKVTGKNKFNPMALKDCPIASINGDNVILNGSLTYHWWYEVTLPKGSYTPSGNDVDTRLHLFYDGGDNGFVISRTFTYDSEVTLQGYISSGTYDNYILSNLQLEEGTVATSYEPYKESTKTLYLNSPLLEGDTIEEKDGGIYHVHRSELVAYTEGDETSLITDKVNTLHKLATPRYELIEQSNLVIPSYANGHLDLSTAVPVEKVDFLPFSEDLTYLYANTQYTVQFISTKAITADITLGGTQLLAQNIVAGLNRISITTPATLADNKLVISGVGANIREVVVTNTDRKFGYFEGMKSVGECEELEVVSNNSDSTSSNTQTLQHEPLRAVGDIKDKYVLIDGKWYIERNCGEIVLDGSDDESWSAYIGGGASNYFISYILPLEDLLLSSWSQPNRLICDIIPSQSASKSVWGSVGEGVCTDTNNLFVCLSKTKVNDWGYFRQWLQQNPTTVVYALATPTYEPIDYNPFKVYSGITHISNNSTIPCNMTIKNTGYNCLLKPSTTYTISSNLGLNTVTTPSTLTEDCLRFMDTDTSDVTTMRDVLILEGDWTSKADLIPANFSGIESAFEQEYDEEKGKYKVNVKVANEDKTKENNITFYINEPLRRIGDVKDRVYVKDDKVVVQRNCGSEVFDGSADEGWYLTSNERTKTIRFRTNNLKSTNLICNKFTVAGNTGTDIPSIYSGESNTTVRVYKSQLSTIDVVGFKQWLQNNPTTIVYQLAEPTYEEVEYNDTKLFIESFKNSTLFYISNIPVSSKLYYSYSVPIVDTVAQTANVTDQQDSMIIDMATQVAVMEMMLM